MQVCIRIAYDLLQKFTPVLAYTMCSVHKSDPVNNHILHNERTDCTIKKFFAMYVIFRVSR